MIKQLVTFCAAAMLSVFVNAEVKNISATEAQALLSSEEVIVLDIRTPEEFAEGHIPGAINIDYYAEDFAEQVVSLDSSKTYLVHCRSGGRSGRSMSVFKEHNFSHVLHLNKGFKQWQSQGLAVDK